LYILYMCTNVTEVSDLHISTRCVTVVKTHESGENSSHDLF
jgi:hypothetical protein